MSVSTHEFPVAIMEEPDLERRLDKQLYVPLQPDTSPQIIDCGDARPLTASAITKRMKRFDGELPTPTRIFGGVSGLAAIAIVTAASTGSESGFSGVSSETQRRIFTDFAANLATNIYRVTGALANTHSSSQAEGREADFNPLQSDATGVDCAFMSHFGMIITLAAEQSVREEVDFTQSLMGTNLPTDQIFAGISRLRDALNPSFSIGRRQVRATLANPLVRTPFVVLDGAALPTPDTTQHVVYDYAGFQADAGTTARAGHFDYHHTPPVATEILTTALPEHGYNPNLLTAAGLVFGVATRQALSKLKGHELPALVIPSEYARIAA